MEQRLIRLFLLALVSYIPSLLYNTFYITYNESDKRLQKLMMIVKYLTRVEQNSYLRDGVYTRLRAAINIHEGLIFREELLQFQVGTGHGVLHTVQYFGDSCKQTVQRPAVYWIYCNIKRPLFGWLQCLNSTRNFIPVRSRKSNYRSRPSQRRIYVYIKVFYNILQD